MAAQNFGKKRLLTNAAANFTGFAAQVVVAFFLSPILINGLGERRYGVWSLVESVLAYLTVLDLGLTVSVVRYVAKFEANSEHDNQNRIFSTSLCLFGLSGLVVLAISSGLALLWPDPLGVPADAISDVRWLLFLLGFNVAVGFPLGVFGAVLAGLERYPVIATIRTTALIVRAVSSWLVIYTGGGLVTLALVITGFTIAEQLVMIVAAKVCLPTLRFSWSLVTWDMFRMIRGYSFAAFVALIAGRVSFQTDALVIGAFMMPEFITFFAVGARLVAYAKDTLRTLTAALTPAVSAFDATNDYQAIDRLMIKGSRFVLYLAVPMQLGFWLLGLPFLSLWLGDDLAVKSYPTLIILSVPLVLAISQSISSRILYGIGQLRWYATATVVEAVANLILSLLWVQPYGIEGVAWGTALPNVVFNVTLLVYVCRKLKMPLSVFLWRAAVLPFILAPVPALCWWGLGEWLGLGTWPLFFAIATAGWLVHALLCFVVEGGAGVVLAWIKARSLGSAALVPPIPTDAILTDPR